MWATSPESKATGRSANLARVGISAAASFGKCCTLCLSFVGSCILRSPLHGIPVWTRTPTDPMYAIVLYVAGRLGRLCPPHVREEREISLLMAPTNDKRRYASGILLQ